MPTGPNGEPIITRLTTTTIHKTLFNDPSPAETALTVTFDIKPPKVTPPTVIVAKRSNLIVRPIVVPLVSAMTQVVVDLVGSKIENFFDDDRELKTLLNFGEDRQAVVTNWKYDENDVSAMLVKLYQPLPETVQERDLLWVSREISSTVIDKLFVQNDIQSALLTYLRPSNRNISIVGIHGATVTNATLNTLLPSSSMFSSSLSFTDTAAQSYYSTDVSNVELNTDYSKYQNFIHFSSAKIRLDTFWNKISLIQKYGQLIASQSISLNALPTGSPLLSGSVYGPAKNFGEQRDLLIKGFDGYERFMYEKTAVPYSSSFSGLLEDTFYINSDSTFPKQANGTLQSVTSSLALNWYVTQGNIASKYDNGNANSLLNNLPQYIVEDASSADFSTFISLVGHHFDLIKPYIDSMTDIYDRGDAIDRGMSRDLIWNVAQSLGVDLPNKYAIRNLYDYILGVNGGDPFRDRISETWKRFISNHMYFNKTKGTKASLQGLINTYGVMPSLINIRESTSPSAIYTASFESFDEVTNVLNITNGAKIQIPWATMSRPIIGLEVRVQPIAKGTTILVSSSYWSLETVSTGTGSLGYFKACYYGATTVTSDIMPIFDGYFSVSLQKTGSIMELRVGAAVGDKIEYYSVTKETGTTFSPTFLLPTNIFLGSNFVGKIDEFRVWGEYQTEATFKNHIFYPGLYNGNGYQSARDNLYVRLSFNKPSNLGSICQIINESPYIRRQINNDLLIFPTIGFTNIPTFPYNMGSETRAVVRFTPDVAGSAYSSNKITIAPPPVILSNISGLPELFRNRSIVPLRNKKEYPINSNFVGMFFGITDAVNDSIVRSLGNLSIQNLIGNPADLYNARYTGLEEISKFYWENYSYNFDTNTFVRFTENLLPDLFKQAEGLVPARAKLLTGLVIEPNILERNKIQQKRIYIKDVTVSTSVKNPKHSATTTAKILNITSVIKTEKISKPSARVLNLAVVIPTNVSNQIYSKLQTQFTTINVAKKFSVPSGIYNTVSATINIEQFRVISTAKIRSSGVNEISIINPFVNKEDLGFSTYFAHPLGIVEETSTISVREFQNALKDRGTWVTGSTYNKNDYVTLSNFVGNESIYNGKEFRCISDNTQFSTPPFLDTNHWTPVRYIATAVRTTKKATLQSGSVVLVPTGSAGTPFVGYAPNHYRFVRDNTTAMKRRNYIGCVQTQDTTVDGDSPIETTTTGNPELYVVNGTPVQRPGIDAPILDVK